MNYEPERTGTGCPTMAEVRDAHFRAVLADVRGDKAAAARLLGVSLKTVYNWSKRLERQAKPKEGSDADA